MFHQNKDFKAIINLIFRAGSPLVLCAALLAAFSLASTADARSKRPRAKQAVAQDARLGGDDNRVRFVADLSKKVKIRVFALANPYRVIVDLPEVKFKFPSHKGRKGKGLVTAYRYGRFAPGKSRIVIDVKSPVKVEQAYVIDARGSQPARLVLDLARTTRAQFARLQAQRPTPSETKPPETQSKLQGKILAQAAGDNRPVIIIDPGHGGVDPGAIGSKGTLEKNVVLNFAKVLQKKLLQSKRYRVVMTRDIDTYIPLHDRVKYARDNHGGLFISIHADSISRRRRNRNRVRGASIYILSEEGSDDEARALAALENRADIIAGVELPKDQGDISSILIDLAQRETNSLSRFFARLQLKQMRGVVKTHGRRVRSAGFRVLKAPDIPSILLELGYLSSIYDERNLKNKKWVNKTANVVVKSVHRFFRKRVALSPY